ncbi:MAG: 3-keto-5-aminohexanoate cleavage protein [Alphaproteobacteria bacterium]|nr:3-keto-5-aminohexanoate cleavage protein [Alphaproteobacteria bacterium]
MSLSPLDSCFITCAVTGAGATTHKNPHVPITPQQIATSALEAGKAGAAIVHLHVRDPHTGAPSRSTALYEEAVHLIRRGNPELIINLTAGHGGDLTLGAPDQPLPPLEAGTDMASASDRTAHLRQIKPDIATLDCGTMNFGEGDYIMTNTPAMLYAMAREMQAIGVKPEIEAFDFGHLEFAKKLVADGLIDAPVLVQLCMGVPWGAPNDMQTLAAMAGLVPEGWIYSAFTIGRHAARYAALAPFAGANVRVGLEDNLYLRRGQVATNADLVEQAVLLLTTQGVAVKDCATTRAMLGL